MSAALSFDDEVDDQVAAAVADVARAVFAGHAATPRTDLLGALGKSGLLGLGVPQDRGGSGGSALLAALVAEQAGVALTAPDVLHQWVGVVALAAAGADVEDIAAAYVELRARPEELFIETVKRTGVEPFRERVYATR